MVPNTILLRKMAVIRSQAGLKQYMLRCTGATQKKLAAMQESPGLHRYGHRLNSHSPKVNVALT
ncbi:MAG: hypothetical protein CG446_1123 [Methanosaeta sp. ASO1]|nr:MAG: hypothetical protein CG446_1123 [Methanosaeta sp. ASO1]